MSFSRRLGFTLIELLVVIAIIGLLSSIVVSAVTKVRVKARDTARVMNARQLAIALQQYSLTTGSYRVAGAGYQSTGAGYMSKSLVTDYATSIVSILKNSKFYTASTLKDPVFSDNNYYLGVCDATQQFDIYLKLEQSEYAQGSSTVAAGCDGAGAVALGFNYLSNKGSFDASSTASGGGGGGGGGVGSIGSVWSPVTGLTINGSWSNIIYAGGKYLAMAYTPITTSNIATSVDGQHWTESAVLPGPRYTSLSYGGGKFVAVGAAGVGHRAMSSVDGVNWSAGNTNADNFWTAVAYGNATHVAVGDSAPNELAEGVQVVNGCAMTSTDGVNWVYRTTPGGRWTAIVFANGKFVAVRNSNTYLGTDGAMTSPDGITWTAQATPDGSWESITYGNGLFVAAAKDAAPQNIMTSPDGVNWTIRNTGVSSSLTSIAFGNGTFVAVSEYNIDSPTVGRIITSTDGINWSPRDIPTDIVFHSVTYGNNAFIAVSDAYSLQNMIISVP